MVELFWGRWSIPIAGLGSELMDYVLGFKLNPFTLAFSRHGRL
jgi:hypothetical protein